MSHNTQSQMTVSIVTIISVFTNYTFCPHVQHFVFLLQSSSQNDLYITIKRIYPVFCMQGDRNQLTTTTTNVQNKRCSGLQHSVDINHALLVRVRANTHRYISMIYNYYIRFIKLEVGTQKYQVTRTTRCHLEWINFREKF